MALKEWNGGNGAGEAPGRPQSFNWRRGSNVANFRSTPDSISISISHSKGVPLTDNHPHPHRRRRRRPRWVSVYYYRLIDTASGVTTVQSLGIHFIASHFRRQSIGHMRCTQFKKECYKIYIHRDFLTFFFKLKKNLKKYYYIHSYKLGGPHW